MPTIAGPSVLITGTSSGIGFACARVLARRGWRVFAGVRKLDDGARVRENCGAHLQPVLIDVTDERSISLAHEEIRASVGGSGLDALVNNAGISVASPMEFVPLDDLRRQFEVNVLGQVAVTQAFLPLVRRARGRVVFVSSTSGWLAAPMLGPYAASKHAIEAIADSMRIELAPHGVRVIVVEPGAIQSEIWDKGIREADARAEAFPEDAHTYYDDMIDKVRSYARNVANDAIPAAAVGRTVSRALTSSRPRPRYVVGKDAQVAIAVHRWLPAHLRDRLIRLQLGI